MATPTLPINTKYLKTTIEGKFKIFLKIINLKKKSVYIIVKFIYFQELI